MDVNVRNRPPPPVGDRERPRGSREGHRQLPFVNTVTRFMALWPLVHMTVFPLKGHLPQGSNVTILRPLGKVRVLAIRWQRFRVLLVCSPQQLTVALGGGSHPIVWLLQS